MKNYKTIRELVERLTAPIAEGVEPEPFEKDFCVEGYKVTGIKAISEDVDCDAPITFSLVFEADQRPIIGNTVVIGLPELGCEGLEAKVDTGAEMSCLHAENIKVNGDSVAFTFNSKKITMNTSGSVDIQTADNGVEPRPIVRLHVETEYGTLNGVDFNLNDRSEMPHQILLGKTFLQAGEFLIDPLTEEPKDDD